MLATLLLCAESGSPRRHRDHQIKVGTRDQALRSVRAESFFPAGETTAAHA
jgi:hypothetical protein